MNEIRMHVMPSTSPISFTNQFFQPFSECFLVKVKENFGIMSKCEVNLKDNSVLLRQLSELL